MILIRREKTDPEYKKQFSENVSKSLKQQYKNGRKASGCFGDEKIRMECTRKAQSPEARAKRDETRKKNKFQQGKNNSQYGTTWIWHEMIGNKKIKKELLPYYIEQGWIKKYIPGYKISLG